MPTVFADTAYYVAVLIEQDELHDRAVAFDAELPSQRTVPTDAVLVEVLAYFSRRGRAARLVAVELVDALEADPRATIIHRPPNSSSRALTCTAGELTMATA